MSHPLRQTLPGPPPPPPLPLLHPPKRCRLTTTAPPKSDTRVAAISVLTPPLTTTRAFTTTLPTAGTSRQRPPSKKAPSQPSTALNYHREKEKALREAGMLPNDVGILAQTLVMPALGKRPSWLAKTKERWALEKKRVVLRAREFSGTMMYRWLGVQPRPRLYVQRVPVIAKELHRSMYEQFAAGDLGPVEHKLCDGIRQSLEARIEERPPNTYLKWRVNRYLEAPSLKSYKAALMPGEDGRARDKTAAFGVVQAVVRIRSEQSLATVRRVPVKGGKGKSKGKATKEVVVDAMGVEKEDWEEAMGQHFGKEVTEYLVIQKLLKNSREGEWMVWGTTEETPVEVIKNF